MYVSIKKAGGWHNLYLQLEQERKARQGRDSEKQKRGRSRPLTSGLAKEQLKLWGE